MLEICVTHFAMGVALSAGRRVAVLLVPTGVVVLESLAISNRLGLPVFNAAALVSGLVALVQIGYILGSFVDAFVRGSPQFIKDNPVAN